MPPRATSPNSVSALPELDDLMDLLRTGYLDSWAQNAASLLQWPRYRESKEPTETLIADVRSVLAYMPGEEGNVLRTLIPTNAEKASSQTSRWGELKDKESGSALKWHRDYLLMRLLAALQERRGSTDSLAHPPGCQILSVDASLALVGKNYSTRVTTLGYRLRSTRDDFRIFTFNRPGRQRGRVVRGEGVKIIGSAPTQGGATTGACVFAVYLGRIVPIGEEIEFAVQFRYRQQLDLDPWISYAARYSVGRVKLAVDAPRDVTARYECIEYDDVHHGAGELRRKPVDRSDDTPMDYPINDFVPYHRYRLAWIPAA
jgi:hypothetical protein